MPAEPKTKLKRRSSKRELESEFKFDGGHARELELKRSRGEVSCAECRRLKIKCDKQIPCTSCQRRGCAALCPNGSLATGQGTRFVLAATEHLHRRITKLSGRIRELEDALSTLHAKHSTQPHPLLDESLIESTPADDEENIDAEGPRKIKADELGEGPSAGGEVIDTFGTLSISDHGVSRFFGPTGGSESLLMENSPSPEKSVSPKSSPYYHGHNSPPGNERDSLSPASTSASNIDGQLSATLSLFSRAFPFTPLGLPLSEVQSLIETYLPPYDKALELVELFFEQVSWLFRGLPRDQVEEDMLPSIYRRRPDRGSHEAYEDATMHNGTSKSDPVGYPDEEWNGPHDLALLFVVFALGALVGSDEKDIPKGRLEDGEKNRDMDTFKIPKHLQVPPIVEHYHQLCRAALSLQPVLEKPSVVTVQALHLLSVYNAFSGDGDQGKGEKGMEMTWSLLTVASHLSMTIGLHRDSARWGLSRKMIQRRRLVFWDLFVGDIWTSLMTGRPPTFSLAYIDCSFPEADSNKGSKGKGKHEDKAYETWNFRFAAEVVAEISAKTLTAEAPTYATIMELDRKVREFPLPEALDPSRKSTNSEEDMVISFQRFIMEHIKETMLIYIHRSFFAQAIIDQPINPLKSTFAPSFLAAYRSSGTILKCVKEQFSMWPNSAARHWAMWTFAFSAAVIFGTVVTRGPRSPLAQSAMVELDQACVLFSKAAAYSPRAWRALPILTKLRDKAQSALQAVKNDPGLESGDDTSGGALWNVGKIKKENEDSADELSIFAGHTRFISVRQKQPGTGSASPADSPPMNNAPNQIRLEPLQPAPGEGSRDVQMDMDVPFEASRYLPERLPPSQPQLHHLSGYDPRHAPGPSPTSRHIHGWMDDRDRDMRPSVEYNHLGSGPHYSDLRSQPAPTITIPPATPPPSSSNARLPPPPQQPQYDQVGYGRGYVPDYSWPPHHQEYSSSSQHHSHPHQPPISPDSTSVRLSQSRYPSVYGGYTTPQQSYHSQQPSVALADLGLAARDSRLDERWSSFMQDSGLLDDMSSQYGRGRIG